MNETSLISERPLTLEEAAEYLSISRYNLRILCRKKKISHSRLDYRNWRFRKADLDAYLENRYLVGS
jgi:excisionase family DNA binding protein